MSKRHHGRKHKPPRIHRRTQPGAAPGTVVVDPAAPPPEVTVIAFDGERIVESPVKHLAELPAFLARGEVTWVNVDGLGDGEIIHGIGKLFGLHPLALEDVVNVHQRAKVEEYDRQTFIVARMVEYGEQLLTEQVSLFLGQDYVLTFQERPGRDSIEPVRDRLRKGHGRLRTGGADHLAYSILDAVIDGYFPVLERYSDLLDALEEDVTTRPDRGAVARLHSIKGELLVLRRALWPLRDALNELVRGDSQLVRPETRVYLRDCFDHTVQLIDLIETYRELGADLRDLYLSSVSNRMNEIMKVLTVISTIFMPLSVVVGYYGMNFRHFPELGWPLGLGFVWGVMSAVVLGLVAFFRNKGWLSSFVSQDALPHDAEPPHGD